MLVLEEREDVDLLRAATVILNARHCAGTEAYNNNLLCDDG